MSFIEIGKEAKLVTGGARVGDKGYYVAPTLFVDPGLDTKIYKEEIFGPVGTVRTFSTEEEVVELANDTSFGLSGTPCDDVYISSGRMLKQLRNIHSLNSLPARQTTQWAETDQ